MQFDEVILQLSRQLNLPTLVPGPSGTCALRFDDIVVTFTHVPTDHAFDLSARIGRVDLREPAVALALQDGRESTSALQWDDSGEVRMRQRFWLAALSFPHFFRAMERFVNQADHWRARLALR